MIIIKLTGGLGNQMFQYALYQSLHKKDTRVFIDDTSFERRHPHEHISLKEIFPGLSFQKAADPEISRLADLKRDYFNKIRRNVIGMRRTHIQESDINFKKHILELNGDFYLDGYWQSEKYFEAIDTEVRSAFSFRQTNDRKNIELMETMRNENSVSIHIRKGNDFQGKSRLNICDREYYRQAIDRIGHMTKDPVFYIFSDNFKWAAESLEFVDARFVDWNASFGADSYLDMQIMSCCRNNIIANSSYSWWSAWLNDSAEKTVIAPRTWFNDNTVNYRIEDILPGSWITI
jgi:hypothetical protein